MSIIFIENSATLSSFKNLYGAFGQNVQKVLILPSYISDISNIFNIILERRRFPRNIDIPWNIVEYGGILRNI